MPGTVSNEKSPLVGNPINEPKKRAESKEPSLMKAFNNKIIEWHDDKKYVREHLIGRISFLVIPILVLTDTIIGIVAFPVKAVLWLPVKLSKTDKLHITFTGMMHGVWKTVIVLTLFPVFTGLTVASPRHAARFYFWITMEKSNKAMLEMSNTLEKTSKNNADSNAEISTPPTENANSNNLPPPPPPPPIPLPSTPTNHAPSSKKPRLPNPIDSNKPLRNVSYVDSKLKTKDKDKDKVTDLTIVLQKAMENVRLDDTSSNDSANDDEWNTPDEIPSIQRKPVFTQENLNETPEQKAERERQQALHKKWTEGDVENSNLMVKLPPIIRSQQQAANPDDLKKQEQMKREMLPDMAKYLREIEKRNYQQFEPDSEKENVNPTVGEKIEKKKPPTSSPAVKKPTNTIVAHGKKK